MVTKSSRLMDLVGAGTGSGSGGMVATGAEQAVNRSMVSIILSIVYATTIEGGSQGSPNLSSED